MELSESSPQIFSDSFLELVGPLVNPEDKSELDKIAQSHLETLTAIRTGYFSQEDQKKISAMAAKKLGEVYIHQKRIDLHQAWQIVAEDFHSKGHWGFKTISKKPKAPKKKNEMVGFLWTAFQAAIIMKLIVLYFGVNAAEMDSTGHYIGLGVALFLSFASLLYFAYRKSKTYKD